MGFPEIFNLADYCLFSRVSAGGGESVAVRYGDRSYLYKDVAERSAALARFLATSGVRPGDRVVVMLPDSPAYVWSVMAIWKAGAVLVMGNPDAPVATLEATLALAQPAAVIAVPRVCEALAAALDRARKVSLQVIVTAADTATGEDPDTEPAPLGQGCEVPVIALAAATDRGRRTHKELPVTRRDDPAVWLFSSGSSGRPRAAVHAHRDLAYSTEVYARATVGFGPSDTTMSVPRLYFGYATGTNLVFPFAVGATVALFSERPTAPRVAAAIARYRPTIVTNVPTMLSMLLDHDERERAAGNPGMDLASVRFQLSAGEALPAPLYHRFIARFGGAIYDGIGSAEMFHIFVTNRPGDVVPGSLGRPVDGYEVRILPADATGPGAPEVADGEPGVLWVRGQSIALGYARDRDASWERFFGPWCQTGDVCRRDARGYLWLCGRADALFKVCGQWVAPLEVEACLMEHPAVSMAMVMADAGGELLRGKALVVLRNPQVAAAEGHHALTAALREHVAANLARHKVPRIIEIVAELPHNDRGKIDRRLLSRQHAAQTAAPEAELS